MTQEKEKENNYKTCIHCSHWYFHSGYSDWSEVTPGENWSMGCSKDHFLIGGEDSIEGELRKELMRARDCKDFEERKD